MTLSLKYRNNTDSGKKVLMAVMKPWDTPSPIILSSQLSCCLGMDVSHGSMATITSSTIWHKLKVNICYPAWKLGTNWYLHRLCWIFSKKNFASGKSIVCPMWPCPLFHKKSEPGREFGKVNPLYLDTLWHGHMCRTSMQRFTLLTENEFVETLVCSHVCCQMFTWKFTA